MIKKDVPRTDRSSAYFQGENNVHLEWLSDVLTTYALNHQDVGYAQGMNDLLSMILSVTDHEADAYWCFTKYMETIQADFMAEGMMEKMGGSPATTATGAAWVYLLQGCGTEGASVLAHSAAHSQTN